MARILMPKLGLTMTEGLLSEWRVQPGESFAKGDVLFVVETEKIANEVEADVDGVLDKILVPEGETVQVGTAIASLEGDEVGNAADAPNQWVGGTESVAESEPITGTVPLTKPAVSSRADGRIVATPLARRIAKLEGVDLRSVTGSGAGGRIKAKDVRAAAAILGSAPAIKKGAVHKVIVDAVRAATARRVSAAKREIPHFYVTRCVEITALQQLRNDLNSDETAVRISVTHLLVKALALALVEMPEINRIWAGEEILTFDTADIGMVAETPNGLRIPMIRSAEMLTLDQVASAAKTLADRIKADALTSADVGGGAISISNVGMFGADSLTPIISPPQSMILGVGAEQQLFRPDANGNPALCRELILTLACDHRVTDGADAARFLSRLVNFLEKPARLTRITN
jgi:pyruvate dehydrogenase E2 component (dihydrolipoamide acetyltransferase)